MELTEIVTAIQENPELLKGITTHVIGTDHGKEIINNRSNQIYDTKIGDEVKSIYGRFDQDTFEILGERPGEGTDGKKMKTYDFNKKLISELKDWRGKGNELTKDNEVIRLNGEITKLKEEGGGKHWEQTFNTEKEKWLKREDEYKNSILDLTTNQYNSLVENQLSNAKANLKINPDTPKVAVDALYNIIKADMITKSKRDGDNIVYLDSNGSVITDVDYKPDTAEGILKKRMADVLLKDKTRDKGGADSEITGSIKTTKVEGKADQKSLVLNSQSFTTRVGFEEAVTKALVTAGITKSNDDYYKLKNKAHLEYDVNKLPRS